MTFSLIPNLGSPGLRPPTNFNFGIGDQIPQDPTNGLSAVSGPTAAMNPATSFFGSRDFGLNGNTIGMGFQGLSSLGNLWGAFQSNKLARDQLDFTKNFATKNLANQTQSYNTALEDRARSRGVMEGQSSQQVQGYIDRNRLNN